MIRLLRRLKSLLKRIKKILQIGFCREKIGLLHVVLFNWHAIKTSFKLYTCIFFLLSKVMVNWQRIKNKIMFVSRHLSITRHHNNNWEKLHCALLNQTLLYIQLAKRAGKVFSIPLNRKTLMRLKWSTKPREIIKDNYSFVVQLDF